jgi:hypothetical protein
MAKNRSVPVICGLFGLTLVFGVALEGCGGGTGENETLAPPAPRQGRDSMDSYKADMKNKPANPAR